PTSRTALYTLSLHDALPIFIRLSPLLTLAVRITPSIAPPTLPTPPMRLVPPITAAAIASSSRNGAPSGGAPFRRPTSTSPATARSEEHTSELQSRENLVCRL